MDRPNRTYLEKLPKAEIHLHLEGSVDAPLLLDLSRKYSTEYSALSQEELAAKLFRYEDFSGFIDTFRIVCEHLRRPEDYVAVLDRLAGYCSSQNIQYAELICSPSIPWHFGLDGREILEALLERSLQLGREQGLRLGWILDCVRQWGPEPAQRTAELAVECMERGVVGLGLGGDENSLPMADFKEIFHWAKASGLFIHVHAGETGGPDQVWDALRILGANRIGHGIQSARDAALMEHLRERAIGLDVCLTSNLKTRAWSPISTNPFGMLFRRGLHVSLNSDDPGLFETTLVDEFSKAVRFFQLNRQDVNRLALEGLRSAFLPHDERLALMQKFTDEIHSID